MRRNFRLTAGPCRYQQSHQPASTPSNTNNQPATNPHTLQRHCDYGTVRHRRVAITFLAFRQHSAPPCSSPRPPSTSRPPLCPSLPAVAVRRRIRRTLPSPVGRRLDDSGLAAPKYRARAVLRARHLVTTSARRDAPRLPPL